VRYLAIKCIENFQLNYILVCLHYLANYHTLNTKSATRFFFGRLWLAVKRACFVVGWLWKEPVVYSRCSKWCPFAFTYACSRAFYWSEALWCRWCSAECFPYTYRWLAASSGWCREPRRLVRMHLPTLCPAFAGKLPHKLSRIVPPLIGTNF